MKIKNRSFNKDKLIPVTIYLTSQQIKQMNQQIEKKDQINLQIMGEIDKRAEKSQKEWLAGKTKNIDELWQELGV